eukprot:gene32059-39601_t
MLRTVFVAIDRTIGLRVTEEVELAGLDRAFYNEGVFNKDSFAHQVPQFDEPVQIRFSSSHARNVVKEVTGGGGSTSPKLNKNNINNSADNNTKLSLILDGIGEEKDSECSSNL